MEAPFGFLLHYSCGDIQSLLEETFPRGLSQVQATGRLPVDVDVEISWRLPADIRGGFSPLAGNPLVFRNDLGSAQRLRLLTHRQLREFEGNSTASNSPVPVRILHEVLLVIVGAEASSCTEITELSRRGKPTGRLSVDVDIDPPVDRHGLQSPNNLHYRCPYAYAYWRFRRFLVQCLKSEFRCLPAEVQSCATRKPVASER